MKRVVVLGGGFAGTCIALRLQKSFAVTLIDSKSYFEFTPSILRTIVEPDHWNKIRVLHKAYLPHTRVILGVVSRVNKRYVQVGNERISFDYLAICSGSSYNSPIKEQNVILPMRARHLVEAHKSLEKAESVLIIGGGLVGVELAAEIITHYPNKRVSIIHPHRSLIPRNNHKSQIYATRFLQRHGVNIVYNDKVIENKHGVFLTEKGRKLNADIVFLCTGITPNFSFLKGDFAYVLNKVNQVRVNKHLQVSGCSNIFAAGDITNIAVEKTAQNAEKQAEIVAANTCALEQRKPLISYNQSHTPQVISLGKRDGIFEFGSTTITGFMPVLLKVLIEKREMWRRGGFLK